MLKNILKIFLVLVILLACAGTAQAVIYGYDTKTVGVGHNFGDIDDETDGVLNFIVVDSAGQNLYLFDAYTGDRTLLVSTWDEDGQTQIATLDGGIVLSSGHLVYTVTVDSTRYVIQRRITTTTPTWHTGHGYPGVSSPDPIDWQNENAVRVLDSGVGVTLREDSGKIWYHKGHTIYSANIGQWLSNVEKIESSPAYMDFISWDVYNGIIYSLHMGVRGAGGDGIEIYYIVDGETHHFLRTTVPSGSGLTRVGAINVLSADRVYIESYVKTISKSQKFRGIYNNSHAKIGDYTYIGEYYGQPHQGAMTQAMSYIDPVMVMIWSEMSAVNVVGVSDLASDPTIPDMGFAELEYERAGLSGLQNQYFNNSDLDVTVRMKLSMQDNDYGSFAGTTGMTRDYEWSIRVYNPNGQIVGTHEIRPDEWSVTGVVSIISDQTSEINKRYNFRTDGVRPAGTYTFRLIETGPDGIDRQVVQRTIEVLDESGTITPGTPDLVDVGVSDLWNNPYFMSLAIITCAGMGLGLVAGIGGAIAGMTFGVFAGFMMGLVPMPFLILSVMTIIFAITVMFKDRITGGGGGE